MKVTPQLAPLCSDGGPADRTTGQPPRRVHFEDDDERPRDFSGTQPKKHVHFWDEVPLSSDDVQKWNQRVRNIHRLLQSASKRQAQVLRLSAIKTKRQLRQAELYLDRIHYDLARLALAKNQMDRLVLQRRRNVYIENKAHRTLRLLEKTNQPGCLKDSNWSLERSVAHLALRGRTKSKSAQRLLCTLLKDMLS